MNRLSALMLAGLAFGASAVDVPPMPETPPRPPPRVTPRSARPTSPALTPDDIARMTAAREKRQRRQDRNLREGR